MRAQPETGQAWRNAAPHSPLERFPSYASYRFALPGKPPACGAARLLRRLRQARACRGSWYVASYCSGGVQDFASLFETHKNRNERNSIAPETHQPYLASFNTSRPPS